MEMSFSLPSCLFHKPIGHAGTSVLSSPLLSPTMWMLFSLEKTHLYKNHERFVPVKEENIKEDCNKCLLFAAGHIL